jgi:Na+-transporting methylmalonyl-CoA/oxaloacetate decarboxylase gamma subunit
VTSEALRRLARTAWKVTLVLALTIAVMWMIGRVIEATTGSSDETVTTEKR